MGWYLKALKQYVNFRGRATRKEYWMFVLFNFLIMLGLTIIDVIIILTADISQSIFSNLYSLAVFLPSLAVGARRLHDTGRSGWWLLLGIVPLIGLIVLIIFFVQDSEPNENQYGPNPKLMRV